MKVVIQKVDWNLSQELPEGTVSFLIRDHSLQAFSCGHCFSPGNETDVCISHLEGQLSWEERFSKNSEMRKELVSTGEWSYDGFGQIVSIRPVIADFGILRLDLGYWSNDPRIVGEFIFWRIARLDISPKWEEDKA